MTHRTISLAGACMALWLLAAPTPAGAQPEMPPAPVVVAAVVSRDVAPTHTFVGTVHALHDSTVGGEVEGLVVELLAREGDRVKKDQPVAKLRTRGLELQIASAKGLLDSRREELRELENGARKGELEQSRARVAAAVANAEYAKWQLDSSRKLYEAKQGPEGNFQLARSGARRADALLEAAQAELALLEEGPRRERIAAAKAALRAQEAAVGLLEDKLERHTVRAPFDGYVVAEHTEVGEWLQQGGAVVQIAALDRVDVVVPVLEDYVPKLTIGSSATVHVHAVGNGRIEGKLAVIVPSADPRTRTFPVKVRVTNRPSAAGLALKAGMSANVTLSVGKPEPALLVPKDALVLGGRTAVLYVVDVTDAQAGIGTARPVPVELGPADGDLIAIRADLPVGTLVTTRGNERLRPGQTVKFTKTGDEPGRDG